jgi:hypothetical protein
VKSYADRIEDAHKVIERALENEKTLGDLKYCVVVMTTEGLRVVHQALQAEKRLLEHSKPPEG